MLYGSHAVVTDTVCVNREDFADKLHLPIANCPEQPKLVWSEIPFLDMLLLLE